jgi:hypothetical protein
MKKKVMGNSKMNSRREFLQKMLAASAMAGFYPYLDSCREMAGTEIQNIKMALRPLGATGHMVGIYSLGGRLLLKLPGKRRSLST